MALRVRFAALAEALRPRLPWLLATWFVVISAMRLVVIVPGGFGLDGRLYRAATVAWLGGGDPWLISINGISFGAPPPTLLPMLPFALVPEPIGVGAMLALSIGGSLWAFRRLGMPWWWIAFPPLLDGFWNANPHGLVMPLLVAGLAPLAIFVKLYAGVVPVIRLAFRPLIVTAVLLLVTVPILPWSTYLADLPYISSQFRVISQGGLSVWSLHPVLVPIALAAGLIALAVLLVLERERAAWAAMPVFWPWTEWYYSSLAIPALAGDGAWMIAAAIMAIPIQGGPVLGVITLAIIAVAKRRRARSGESALVAPAPPAAVS
jgi:hypothetical protein